MKSAHYLMASLLLGSPAIFVATDAIAQTTLRITGPTTAGYGNENTLVGVNSGAATTGSENSFFGYNSGPANTSGSNNTFLGHSAGLVNTTGTANTFTGFSAGRSTSIGSYNSFFGFNAGYNNSGGGSNTFVGTSAGSSNTNGSGNTFLGMYAATFNTNGSANTVVGYQAGQRGGVSGSMGNNNVYVGDQAGYNASGSNNTFLGSSAGNVVTAGAQNTMIGSAANVLSPALNRSTALGYGALVGVSDGLVLGDTVNAKIGIGTAYPDQRLTLRGNINFVAFDNSLRLMNEPFLHWDSHQNLALGLGAEIAPGVENALLLGNSLTRVGIGTNAPTARLEIASGREGHSGLRFTDLTARQHPLHTASRFLTVDEQGSVLLARPMVRVDSPDDWADYVFRAEYPLRSLTDLEIFIKEKKHLPGIPSATEMAQQGMEIGPLTGKLVEKIEELSLYLIESDYKYQHLARQYSQVLERLTELESKISAQKLP